MLRTILIGLVAVVAVLAVVIALQPSEYRVARSATIDAPPPVVFAQVNDFHHWEAWSPWAKRDPSMKQTYSGAPAGAGAVYAWAGNNEVGEGRMTILESRPSDLVRIKLDFLKPFAGTATADLTFEPEGDGTAVTWSMVGKNTFMGKAIGLVMNMDRMIGGDFETGLAAMKAVSESKKPS